MKAWEIELYEKGTKYDDDKPVFSCLPAKGLLELGKVAKVGADKYGANNYREGIRTSRFIDAAMRHLLAFMDGEDIDVIDKNHHLASAAWNCLACIQCIKDNPDLDDRYHK